MNMRKPTLLMLCIVFCTAFVIQALQGPVDKTGDAYEIKLKKESFIPDPGKSLDISKLGTDIRHHVMLQFEEMPSGETLEKHNINVLNYVPNNTIIASVTGHFNREQLPGLRWIGQLPPNAKISAMALQKMRKGPDQSGTTIGEKENTRTQTEKEITLVVEGFADVTGEEMEAIVEAAQGIGTRHSSLPEYVMLVTGTPDVFKRLTAEGRIAWVEAASQSLINGGPVHFCPGVKTDYGTLARAAYATNGDGWDGPGLCSAALKYYFINGTPDISGTAERTKVIDAMNEWANHADLTFTAASSAGQNKSLDIRWYPNSHFGSSSILAHAYYPAPPNSESIAGDVHFNEAKNWKLTGTYFHLFTVALHEIGHSLGIAHSSNTNAVMYAYYNGIHTGLHTDDKNAIQSLYSNTGTTLEAPTLNILLERCYGENTLYWNSVSGATSYKVYTSFTNNPDNATVVYSGTLTDISIDINFTTYVWVKAFNSSTSSCYSNMRTALYFNTCW